MIEIRLVKALQRAVKTQDFTLLIEDGLYSDFHRVFRKYAPGDLSWFTTDDLILAKIVLNIYYEQKLEERICEALE